MSLIGPHSRSDDQLYHSWIDWYRMVSKDMCAYNKIAVWAVCV